MFGGYTQPRYVRDVSFIAGRAVTKRPSRVPTNRKFTQREM